MMKEAPTYGLLLLFNLDPKVSWKGYLVTLFNSKLSSYHPKCLRVPKVK